MLAITGCHFLQHICKTKYQASATVKNKTTEIARMLKKVRYGHEK